MKAVVFTLGCKVNECESDSLINGLKNLGYEVSDKLEYADLYIVNTCAVTNEAEKKSRQTYARIIRINPNAKIIYTGCAVQHNSKPFIEKENVKYVSGTFSKNKILENLDSFGVHIYPEDKVFEELLPAKSLRARTFIKVQDGCNNFCSYCLIPYLRGRSRSRSISSIKNEISLGNPKEIVLNGINLSAYNFEGKTLTDLIESLANVDARIRLGSLEVNVIDDRFLTALKNLKNFAPHFHLSLQSGSDKVLKNMNRHYTTKEYLEKVQLIRKYFEFAAITTDIIVGYPTETDEEFINTVNFVDKVEFSDIHPFIFSKRSGTVAEKLTDIDPKIKKQRLDLLMDKKRERKEDFIRKNVGRTLQMLVEYVKDGYAEGYSKNYVRLYVLGDIESEKIVDVKAIKPYKDGLLCEIIN